MEGLRCPLCKEYFFTENCVSMVTHGCGTNAAPGELHAYTCYRCHNVLLFDKPLLPGQKLGEFVSFLLPDYDEETPRLEMNEDFLI